MRRPDPARYAAAMPRSNQSAALLLALAACTSRPLDDGTATSTGDVPDDPTSATAVTSTAPPGTTPPDPSDPGTTPPDPSDPTVPVTTTVTGDTSTSGPFTTVPPDESAGDTEFSTSDVKFDLPPQPAQVPEGLWSGCTKTAPDGTLVTGMSPLGEFVGTRAFFGYDSAGSLGNPRLLILDGAADVDLAFTEFQQNFQLLTGPGLLTSPNVWFTDQTPFWADSDPFAGLVITVGGENVAITGVVTFTGHSGTWDAMDPADPPRLQGTIDPGDDTAPFVGTFDAVFCDALVDIIIAE